MGAPEGAQNSAPRTGLRGRLTHGVVWNLVGTLFNQGSIVLLALALARIFPKDAYGNFVILQSTILGLLGISQQFLTLTVGKHVAEYRDSDPSRLSRLVGLCALTAWGFGLLGAVSLAMGAPWIATSILKAPALEGLLRLSGGIVLFLVVGTYQMGVLAGLESYVRSAKASLLSGLVFLVGVMTGALRAGLPGAMLGWLACAMLRWAVFEWAIRVEFLHRGLKVGYAGAWSEHRVLSGFAVPSALIALSAMPALWLAGTFLFRLPGGNLEMAVFGAALNLRQVVLLIPGIANNVVLVLMANLKGGGDERRYRRLFWANLGLTAGSVLLAGGFMFALGPWVLGLLGKGFVGGTPVLGLLVLSGIAIALNNAIYQLLLTEGKLWMSFLLLSLPRDVGIVALAWVLAPRFGAVGLAWAHVAAYGLSLVLVGALTFLPPLRRRAGLPKLVGSR